MHPISTHIIVATEDICCCAFRSAVGKDRNLCSIVPPALATHRSFTWQRPHHGWPFWSRQSPVGDVQGRVVGSYPCCDQPRSMALAQRERSSPQVVGAQFQAE